MIISCLHLRRVTELHCYKVTHAWESLSDDPRSGQRSLSQDIVGRQPALINGGHLDSYVAHGFALFVHLYLGAGERSAIYSGERLCRSRSIEIIQELV